MPFAPCACAVAVILEYLSNGRAALGNDAGVSVPVIGKFRDLPVRNPMVVTSRKQRRPRGRTHRRSVKTAEGDSLARNLAQRWRMNLTAEGIRLGRAYIIDEHNENVGGVLGKMPGRRKGTVGGILHGASRCAAGRLGWKW